MEDRMSQIVDTGRITAELEALQSQLNQQEAQWAKWREGNACLTSQPRGEGLQQLRDRIQLLQYRLAKVSGAKSKR
jgi:hypothetical protein